MHCAVGTADPALPGLRTNGDASNEIEVRPAPESLCGLLTPVRLAAQMGTGLGQREVLLRPMPDGRQAAIEWPQGRPMTTLRPVFGDQLSHDLPSLAEIDAARDVVLMMEVADETTYVPHHKQKLVLVLSAMRHFAAELRRRGLTVDYVELESPGNTGSFTEEVVRATRRHGAGRIVVTEPGEWRVQAMIDSWPQRLGRPVETRVDSRFFSDRAGFATWATNRKVWRMEHFYREMRRLHGVLMAGDEPVGERWNFDAENRAAFGRDGPGLVPPPPAFPPDAITREVLGLVDRKSTRLNSSHRT